jgi:hypothetical protein
MRNLDKIQPIISSGFSMINVSNVSFVQKMSVEMSNILPPEILLKIFHHLTNLDMKVVVLVCRKWSELGETPSLWTWDRWIPVRTQNMFMLESRMQLVKRLWLRGDWTPLEVEDMSHILVRLNKLCCLDMCGINLSSVKAGVLGMIINKMDNVNINKCQLTSQQCETIFNTMVEATKIRMLVIGHNNLTTVAPGTLAVAVNRLDYVSIDHTVLTMQQLSSLLRQAAT